MCLIVFYFLVLIIYIFFFQAEDGIRDVAVTGVQTCALPILAQGVEDGGADVGGEAALEEAKEAAADVGAVLLQGRDDIQAVLLREREVLGAGAGGDVDDACAFRVRDLVPGDDAVDDARLRRQLVEGAAVGEADEGGALDLADDLVLAADGRREGALRDVEYVVALLD